MNNGRPKNIPTCEHGKRAGNCAECRANIKAIRAEVEPLVLEFWENLPKGNGDLGHLFFQAYRMGMKHANTSK
jgi:hypothetical protein